LFNEKNTELSVKAMRIYPMRPIYPKELSDFDSNGNGFKSRYFLMVNYLGSKWTSITSAFNECLKPATQV
jgi:hypothetical protein